MDIIAIAVALKKAISQTKDIIASHFVAGTNIEITDNPDGTQTISASGEVSATDEVARQAISDHEADVNNPHSVTKNQVGLGNVDNTSDADKPISTAVQVALNGKQPTISDLSAIRSNAIAGAGAATVVQGIDSTANNYIELKSGQREYFDTTVPTGSIPTGSVGMGFDEGVFTFKSGTKISEGEPNITYGKQFSFYGNGQPLTDYTIYGNTGGVGEKTANLFDGNFPGLSGTIQYMPVYVGNISVTLETTASASTSYDAQVFLLEGNVESGASSATNGVWAGNSRRVAAVDGYVTIAYRNISTLAVPLSNAETWLFERFQLPIICGNTTTNIYIDRPLGTNDSIDYTTSQTAIPTVDGANTLICDTTVQPSKISLTYTGWHSDQDSLQTEITSTNKLSADLVDDTNTTNKFVTSAEKTTISKAVTTDDIGLGTDYFIYNGVRVYISATEPTGDIPDNSIWLGSGAAGVGIFTVTVTADSQDNLTSDKTYSEIMAAYTANQLIFVNWVNNRSSYTLASADRIPLSEINNNQMFDFTRSYVGDREIVVMTISIRDSAIAPIIVTNETVSTV